MPKKVTKKQLIDDLKKMSEQYQKDNPSANSQITREYYRINGKYTETDYSSKFGDFSTFKDAALSDNDQFKLEKRILNLEDENKELKKNNEQLLKKNIEDEDLLGCFQDYLYNTPEYPIYNDTIKLDTNKVFVLNISDIHLGEVVLPQYVNGVNSFNKEECIKRLNIIFSKVEKYAKRIGVKDLYLILNGDLISGGIHQELIRNSDLNEVESILYLGKYLMQKISELTRTFNMIDVEVVVGNHARILQGKPYMKEKTTMNYEYILGQMIKMYFETIKSKKITVNVPESAFMVKKIKSTKFLITHGDILTGSGSGGFLGLPAYSLSMSAAKLYGVLHQIGIDESVQFDHILCGHLHTSAEIPIFNGGACYINGAVIGTNEFSINKMKSVAKKEQTLLCVDNDGVDSKINIKF